MPENYRENALEALADLKDTAKFVGVDLPHSSMAGHVTLVTMWATLAIMEGNETWTPEA